ncbi:hypothetical protein BC831DRAFT_436293 [Entophlyctis helioformis]|nr:hypothetical protein BC831DRAFT_436293 [Entophlyctis helioformis]
MHTIEELHADPQTPEERSLYSGAEHKLAEWSHELRRQLQGKHAVIDTKVTFGAPGAACVHVADAAKVDMVVMAVHGQTDAHSLVMGPVSQFVSTFLKRCPVVLVRDGATENDDVEGDAGVSAKSASHMHRPVWLRDRPLLASPRLVS